MELQQGSLLGGRFKIHKKLGAGGMGVVYLADDQEERKSVAFKILSPAYAKNGLAIQRFKREVYLARKLQHPGIVQVYATGRIGETLFYTMEYVEGKTLKQLIRKEGRFPLEKVQKVITALADIVDHAHKYAVHRDLSPDNVIVMPEGTLKILDFGQAKLNDRTQTDLTATGVHLGKLKYSAPEQRSNAKTVDHRADIYSLGVMAYEMLTGTIPFLFQPLSESCDELPAAIDPVIQRAMATAPEDRYPTATAFAEALAEVTGNTDA